LNIVFVLLGVSYNIKSTLMALRISIDITETQHTLEGGNYYDPWNLQTW